MVWKGKKASGRERQEALNRAMVRSQNNSICNQKSLTLITKSARHFYQGYIKAKNYPSSTSVEVMTEGGESAMFKHSFQSWRDKGQTQGLGTTYSVGKIGNHDL